MMGAIINAEERKRVDNFLENNNNFAETNFNGKLKVICTVTGHEMPYTMEAINEHMKTKKYKANDYDFDQHKPHIIMSQNRHSKNPQLYCQLTGRVINRTKGDIEKHISGKRFKRSLAKFEAASGKEDIEIEDDDVDDGDMWIPKEFIKEENESMKQRGLYIAQREVDDEEEEESDIDDCKEYNSSDDDWVSNADKENDDEDMDATMNDDNILTTMLGNGDASDDEPAQPIIKKRKLSSTQGSTTDTSKSTISEKGRKSVKK